VNKNEATLASLLAAFALGVLLTLLLTLRFDNARYVPYGQGGSKILDTRNGRVYGRGVKGQWVLGVKRVGKE